MNWNTVDIWRALAGIAIFLQGMKFLEDGIKQLAGRNFKLFLRKQSSRKINAIGSAAIVTGVLQSSSVVNLMVLAFVGADIINMQQALALTIGANLGTTLDTWFVATVGFKLNMETYALPIIGIAGIYRVFFRKGAKAYNWSSFLFGLGFLFLGLDLMKTGIASMVSNIDLSTLTRYPVVVFVLLGIVITALIQSSSATLAIVLSALHVNAITLYTATAIVLGAEVGTTLKLMLASIGDSPVKKRVALGNFLYNAVGMLIVLAFLQPVNRLITNVIKIKDPLLALSFFQTFINFMSILLFFPFLNVFGRFLEGLFNHKEDKTRYIGKVPVTDIEFSLVALQKEAVYFLTAVIYFSQKVFDIEVKNIGETYLPDGFAEMAVMKQYDYLKQLHGDIYAYSINIQNEPVANEEAAVLEQLIASVRNGMYAAKSMKDAFYDKEQLKNSANQTKYEFYIRSREQAAILYDRLIKLLQKDKSLYFEEIVSIHKEVQNGYVTALNEAYKKDYAKNLSDMEVSTIINFNREIYASYKSIVLAMKDSLLTEKDAVYFDDLPGFIH